LYFVLPIGKIFSMTAESAKDLLVATRNSGKVQELQLLLDGLRWRLRSLKEFPDIAEVEETGATFYENAVLKALTYARHTRLPTLADDSGLEVEALGNAPGIYSARYAGAHATDAERIARVLHELDRADDSERRARFVCVIAIADKTGKLLHTAAGTCPGRIARAPSGDQGFGYDPIFIPDGYEQTFGELSATIKNRISHRARALTDARAFLLAYFQNKA
jgi:XTP/dITP diphosphohydrolase